MRDSRRLEAPVHDPRAIDDVVLVDVAAIEIEGFQAAEGLAMRWLLEHRQRIPAQPVGPALRDDLAGVQIDRQAQAEEGVGIGIEARGLREISISVPVLVLDLRPCLEGGDEALDRAAAAGEAAQHLRQIAAIEKLEPHVAGVARGSRPDAAAVTHRVHERAVAARALAEDAAPAVAAAAEAGLDGGQHLGDEERLPGAHGGAVDVLVAAEAGEAVGKGDDDRRHGARADEAVEALGNVLAVVLPGGVRRAAAGEADEIDEERQAVAVMAGGQIDVDAAQGRIAEDVALQDGALDVDGRHRPFRDRSVPPHASLPANRLAPSAGILSGFAAAEQA